MLRSKGGRKDNSGPMSPPAVGRQYPASPARKKLRRCMRRSVASLLRAQEGTPTNEAMPPAILDHLHSVAAERARRAQHPHLAARVRAIKAYQQRRFELTYVDLMTQPAPAAAARFFLDDLYGPGDFAQRDDQFARVVPALVRLFPGDIVETVEQLAQLHALSEKLDTQMAQVPDAGDGAAAAGLSSTQYVAAWQAVAEPALRESQIALMLGVGHALEGYVRNPLLRQSLKLMRMPARAAGLGALQAFLEKGFDTFRGLGSDSTVFLDVIATRERALAKALFAAAAGTCPPELPSQPL